MRLPVRFSFFSAVLVLGLFASVPLAYSQVQPAVQSTSSQTTGNGTYIVVDPLANVRYDNKYDLSLGMAYDHMKAGPTIAAGIEPGRSGPVRFLLVQQALGRRRQRPRLSGHQRRGPATTSRRSRSQGPFVQEYFFVGGPEWLGPHNKHGALIAHALIGGVYGNFEQDLRGLPPSVVGFYNDQLALAAIIGGHIDLNRSARWVFRITPDAIITRYGINYGAKNTQTDVNFAISVGVEYRFKTKRR